MKPNILPPQAIEEFSAIYTKLYNIELAPEASSRHASDFLELFFKLIAGNKEVPHV